jgi:hypothetical protein
MIRQEDGKFCVLKKNTGEVLKCYDKRREALAYLRALYANSGQEARSNDGRDKDGS